MYRVNKCIYPRKNGEFLDGWIVESDDKYPFLVNKFLHQLNYSSANTAKQYAYKLCIFLNYLENIWNVNYLEAETKHLKKFIRQLQYGDLLTIGIVEGNKSGFTIQSYLNILKSFYEYLYSQDVELSLEFKEKRNINPKSYLYGQSWDLMITKLEIDDAFDRSKPPVDYIKWYTEEQKEAILDNLNTYRDKAIFSISLDGCRIDEILSVKMSNYDDSQGILIIHRSKGRQTGNTGRICILSERSCELLEDYLFHERAVVEMDLLQQNKLPDEEIFLNLRKRDDSYGTVVGYHNILEIIKRAAANAGMDPSKIRTHSGRSTKAGELFRYQAEHPDQLTDDQIKELMGWRRIESAEPYKNRQDRETTLLVARKLQEIKDNRGNLNQRD